MATTWRIANGNEALHTIDELESILLAQRGVAVPARAAFFESDYTRDIHDPLDLHDMDRAVDRIYTAIKKQERILVYGDYDADGVTATALLVDALQQLKAQVTPYLPHRSDDGYGLNKTVLEGLLGEFDLLISADCGVSNQAEIAWLKKCKKDVIVVDHHELPEKLPAAVAILHPRHPQGKYAFAHLCGAGMAWKLACALFRDGRAGRHMHSDDEKWLLDLAALGTIGDVMPLIGENRALVRFGLQVLRRSRRPGIQALIQLAGRGVDLTAHDVAMSVVPRLNAAGRMDHPQPALDLLLARDEQRAGELALQLDRLNTERQKLTRRIVQEAHEHVVHDAPIVFAANLAWPVGIIGLAAGKLAEAYARPAFVIGGNGRHAVGSVRGFGGANVLELLQSAKTHLMKLGGHAKAAGFSVEEDKIGYLRARLLETFAEQPAVETSARQADVMLDGRLITWETLEVTSRFEPFGEGNKRPIFAARRLPILDKRIVGKTGEHAKLNFQTDQGAVDAIGFGLAKRLKGLTRYADVLFQLEVNEFRGRRSLQMNLLDVASAGQTVISD